MRTTPRTLAVLAVGSGLALTPLTAEAHQARVHDPSGDSSSSAVDITALRVAHARHRITARVTIPHLVPGRLSGTELLIRPQGKKRVYSVTVLRDRRGRVAETSLAWRPLNDPVEPTRLPCRRISTSINATHTVVSVAKSCLTRSRPNQPIRAKVRTVDGTVGLQGAYYNDQTRFTPLLRRAHALTTTEAEGEVTASNGLVVRALPTMFSRRVGVLADGSRHRLTCEVTGSVVRRHNDENGDVSNLWYRLPGSRPRWVSALYVRNTTRAPQYCGTGKAYHGRVTARLLITREAPTSRANAHGGLTRGTTLRIKCKLHGQDVRGNDVWYNLPHGLWVAARYVANVGPAPGLCAG